ncbi:MAG: SEC-C metal-binding domain-containing protein [Armatimonadetes bacterium]|nr:SEC-C metal-binding domain-containing protein [Armatimonadota bacterium]
MNILKLFSSNEREIKQFRKIADKINEVEPSLKGLTDEQLRAKTDEFKARIAEGATIDDLLVEAFAVVREAAIRVLGMRHFDVQMIGGMVLHQGRIAEMRTGEGKTLVATLPLYLNALSGKGAHLVTVNDFLSKRDTTWNGPVYHLLGMSVGSIHGQSAESGDHSNSYIYEPDYVAQTPYEWDKLRPVSRKEAYSCDITYGTNHEFGFDYLRDNMAFRLEDLVQREANYAIVDEVDSILIDEARTPLIISGQGNRSSDMYYKMDKVARKLVKERDYTIDEKAKTAMLTEEGQHKVEEITGCGNLSDPDNLEINQYINAALKAHAVFKRDIDYVVKDSQVTIVDEFTGRLMFGRRWSDGLHQAVEAKEGCQIQEENQTLATITYQNYFRLYSKLAGMTGTAKTEEDEFRKIYALDVVEIPTNQEVFRKDSPDIVFKNQEAKFRGLSLEVLKCYARETPTLVGTRSIEVSELVSERLISERLQLLAATVLLRNKLDESKNIPKEETNEYHALLSLPFDQLDFSKLSRLGRRIEFDLNMLSQPNIDALAKVLEISPTGKPKLIEALKDGIVHSILNAKYHEMEAEIISQAGRRGAVTIATNMAGRGVDILLGGAVVEDDEVNFNDLPPFDMGDLKWDFESWNQHNPDRLKNASPQQMDVIMRGGLQIFGTERHESRRIDNQLRGRSGRQGDPGASKFFVSFEDELMRLFGDKSKSFLFQGWRDDQAIDAKLVSRAIERAQKKVEMHHFDMRKHVLEYDDVMNVQRETIYGQRRQILEGADLRATVITNLYDTMAAAIDMFCHEGRPQEEWDYNGLFQHVNEIMPAELFATPEDIHGKKRDELMEILNEIVDKTYAMKEQEIGIDLMRDIERHIALDLINRKWIDHLDAMDFLREGIGLRGYAQRDPIVEYKREAYDLFQQMLISIQDDIVRIMYRVQTEAPPPRRRMAYDNLVEMSADGPQGIGEGNPAMSAAMMQKAASGKIGRNDPCPCGSGKKFKKCCLGKLG